MQDRQILGNGKSKILKAPSDMPETYEEWRAQMLSGTAYVDISPNNETSGENAGISVEGTPLNKASLLTDALATALGLTNMATATPSDAIGAVRPVSLGGTGATTPETARAGLGIGQTLWSSSTAWESGTIAVPGSSNYSLFAIDLAGSSSRVLLMREGNTLRGIGGFMSSASRLYINTAEFTSSGDTWTYGTCGAITLQASGISVTETAMGVYGIYGII